LPAGIPIAHAQEEPPLVPRPYHHVTLSYGMWLEEIEAPEFNSYSNREWVSSGVYGLGYEYRTSGNEGLCFFYQRAGGDTNATLLGGGVGKHFGEGWWILVASIWERRQGDNNGKLRFGLNKEFRLGGKRRTTITPSLNFDLSEPGFNFVLNLSVGRMF
jgi:hypothetical protein